MVFTRVFGGCAFALLSLFDIGWHITPPAAQSFNESMAKIGRPDTLVWRFVASGWVYVSQLLSSSHI